MRIWKRKDQEFSGRVVGVDEVYVYPASVSPYEIAASMVGASVVVRKTEQSINWNSMLLAAVVLVGVPGLWFNALGNKIERQTANANARATRMAAIRNGDTIGAYSGVGGVVDTNPDLWNTPGSIVEGAQNIMNATLQAGYTSTPQATVTPQVTETPQATPSGLYSVNVVFRYSYYNPKLGGVNCFDWDPAAGDCRSMLADGGDWHTEYGKVVACAPDIALGTVVQVTYPDALKGVWVCRDRGGAIVGDLIDFLDIRQRAEWLSPVSATLYPPSTPLDQITNGTH